MNHPYYEWSNTYSHSETPVRKRQRTISSFIRNIFFCLLLLILGFHFFFEHRFVDLSLERKIFSFALIASILLFFLKFENRIFKKDDLSFLDKIPEASGLDSRSVKVFIDRERHEISIEVILKGKDENRKDIFIRPSAIQAFGFKGSFLRFADYIDEDVLLASPNRHVALFLAFIFYGSWEDLDDYLGIMKSFDGDVGFLREKLENVFRHFALKYQFSI